MICGNMSADGGDLHARAVRLATAGWAHAVRVQEVIAALLERGQRCTAAEVLGGLEACAGGRLRLPSGAQTEGAWSRLRALGARTLVVGEPAYPPTLAQAWPELGAPVWLFVCGRDQLPTRRPVVAIVGTREPSHDGVRTAYRLATGLAEAGVVVVSGVARGIDQASHRGALDAGGLTVGVLGTGFGVDYPAGSSRLRRAIGRSGGLLTELAPGVGAKPWHFLTRNRIISGLADATVVVEGRRTSGALQTARLAAAQGRDVWAVPGSINLPTSQAPLALLRDGARPLTALEDLLGDLGVVSRRPEPARADSGEPVRGQVSEVARSVWSVLGTVPASVDELVGLTGHPLPAVLAASAELTGQGLARAVPDGLVRAQ